MSVFVPTGADVAVDPLDVLLVAPNGTTRTTLYLAQGQPVVVAALPAAVVAELNAEAGLVGPDTLFTTPVTASEWPSPIYIAGAQVKRVQSSGATNLGTMVLFALSGFMVTVPAVDLTAMLALINATSSGGGGGGGGSGAVGGPYAPVITGTTATDTGASFIRSGGATPEASDFVLMACNFAVTALPAETVDFEVTLPVTPAALGSEVPTLSVVRTSGDLTLPYIYAQLSGDSTLRIQAVAPVTLETTMQMSLHFSYLVDGV